MKTFAEYQKAALRTAKDRVSGPGNAEESKALHKIPWTIIGATDGFAALKMDIALTCEDLINAACIDELCINDIVTVFYKHGYVIVPEET